MALVLMFKAPTYNDKANSILLSLLQHINTSYIVYNCYELNCYAIQK